MEFRREPAIDPNLKRTNFETEEAVGSQRLVRPDVEPRDTPDPIVYDDEFGKTVLAFRKMGISKLGYKAYDITYTHNDQEPFSLSNYLGGRFFFHWTNHCRFSTQAADGTPAVFVDYDALASSRNHLLSLGHEIGHTNQRDVDIQMWKVLGTEATPELVAKLRKQYPTLTSYVDDLVTVRAIATTGRYQNSKRYLLGTQVLHKPTRGFDFKGINAQLPEAVDEISKIPVGEAPTGPTHLYAFMIGDHFRYTLPGIYMILNAMEEQKAWEFALGLEQEGVIHPGFHSPKERTQYMLRGLSTYDTTYRTDAYTKWLRK